MIKTDHCRPKPVTRAGRSPSGGAGRIGVLLVNLGTPEATDYSSMRRYLKEFLSDRRVIEENRVKWWLDPQSIILSVRPRRKGARLRQDLEPGAQRIAADDHHARRRRKSSRPCCSGSSRRSWSTGRCATAIRRSRRASIALQDAGLRPHPDRAALSAICRRDDRDRLRQGVPVADGDARAAGDPRGAALLRRPGLYRGAGVLGRGRAGQAPLRSRGDPRLVPWHAGGVRRQGRSLSGAVRGDRAAVAGTARARREPLHIDVPVALRHRRVAQALYGRDRAGLGAARGEETSPR